MNFLFNQVYEVIKYEDQEQFMAVMAKKYPTVPPLNNEVKQVKYYSNEVALS